MASDITLEYEIATNFQNISDITEIDCHRIKKDISLIISSSDFDSIETQRMAGIYFNITFKNKLTALTTTETDNITAYIQEFPSEKIAENVTRQAVVSNDPFNPAKYKCIGHAMSSGKKSIFIKASTTPYTLTQDVVLTSDLTITGEKQESCVIDLAGYTISTPTLSYTITGTSVTFTLDSTTVTGVGTTFTAVNSQTNPSNYSLYIEANGQLYEVASIESNTSLTLSEPFRNNTITYPSKRFMLGYFTTNINIKNVIIENSGGFTLNNVINSNFYNIKICEGTSSNLTVNIASNITVSDCCFCNTSSTDATVANLRLRDTSSTKITNVKCLRSGSAGCGMCIDSGVYTSNEISVQNSYFQNNYKGIVIGSPTDPTKCVVLNVVLNNCRIKSNISTGIEMNNYYNTALSPFQNTCVGVILMNSRVSFNGGDGIVMKGEFCKVMNVAVAFNSGNGVVIRSRNNSVSESFVSLNTLCGLKLTSNAFSIKNENIVIQNNVINTNTEHGIYADDNNIEGLCVSGCKISTNTLNGIFIEPASTTTFTADKINISNNTLNDELVIGGKAGCTSNVKRCIIHSNFLKAVTFTANTEALKFVFNFYESLTNGDGTGNNLVDGNGFNTVV